MTFLAHRTPPNVKHDHDSLIWVISFTFALCKSPLLSKIQAWLLKGKQKSQGRPPEILCSGTCLFISKVRGLLGRSHAAEMVRVWSAARPVRCMLGGKWPPTTCQMLESFRLSHFGRMPISARGFCSLYSKNQSWLVKQMNYLINLGVVLLVWQEGCVSLRFNGNWKDGKINICLIELCLAPPHCQLYSQKTILCSRKQWNKPFPLHFHPMGNNSYMFMVSPTRDLWVEPIGSTARRRKTAQVSLLSVNKRIKMWHLRLRKLSIRHVFLTTAEEYRN